MKTLSMFLVLGATFAVAMGGCSSDGHDHDHADGGDAGEHHHEEAPASCEAFHELCEELGEGNAAAKECVDFVHEEGVTEAACAAKKDACIKACTSADGGTQG